MYESSFPFQAEPTVQSWTSPADSGVYDLYVHQLKDAERPVYFSLVRHTLKTNAL